MLPWAQLIKQEQGTTPALSPRCIAQDFANSLQAYGPLQIYEWMNQITQSGFTSSALEGSQSNRIGILSKNRSTSESDVTCDGGLEKGLRNTTLFIDVWQKSNHYYKVIILQLKRNKQQQKRERKKHNLENTEQGELIIPLDEFREDFLRRGHLS